MDSKQQLRLLWSSRWWLAGLAIVAAAAAYLTSSSRPETYEAEALAQVIPAQQAEGSALSTDQLLQATNFYAELARTTPIVRAAEREGSFDVDLEEHVEVSPQPDLLVLEFRGRAPDRDAAAEYANTYAQAFAGEVAALEQEERRQLLDEPQRRLAEIRQRLERVPPDSGEAAALEAELQALQSRLADAALTPMDDVRIIQPALAPQEPSSPQPIRDAILALLAALVLGAVGALLRHSLTDRYASVEEAALDLRLPVLGELPKKPPGDPAALEAFRKLRAQVDFTLGAAPFDGDDGRRALLVTSPDAGAGKTYVSSNLARALAADGRRIVAVDGDLRRPTLHEALDVMRTPGLGELLRAGRQTDLDLCIHSVALSDGVRRRGGALDVLPAGRSAEDTAERLSSPTMAGVMGRLTADYDLVVTDSPPVLAIVDAVVLTRYAAGLVVVVDARRSRRRDIRRAVETLRAVQAPILGLVYNRSSHSEYGYYGPVPAVGHERELTK